MMVAGQRFSFVSAAFPTDKDECINELDDKYELVLSEEEYERLRRLTLNELYLITVLFARALRASSRTDGEKL